MGVLHFSPCNLRLDYGKMTQTETAALSGNVALTDSTALSGSTALTDSTHPVFSWGAVHEGTGRCQSACRIAVGCGDAVIWDSGWVETREQELRYGGTALASGTKYTLSVCLKDDAGQESATVSAGFMTGLYESWDAQWIAAADTAGAESGVRYFRREFDVGGQLIRATLFAAAAGLVRASVNGARCGDAELAPAVSDFSKRCFYTVHDITGLTAPGANCVGIMLGDGWRRNNGAYLKYAKERGMFGLPEFTAMIRLEYPDRVEWVRTGGDWLCGSGPVVSAHLFDGEAYDANLTKKGWDKPGFAAPANGFARAAAVAAPGGVLSVQALEPVKITGAYSAVSLDMVGPGRWIYDFGQNIAGFVRIVMPEGLPAGAELTLRHAEILDENGELYTAPLRGAKATDTYKADGGPVDWRPVFTYHGFRYVELSGFPGIPQKGLLTALAVNTVLCNGSLFECGDALVNAIHKMVVKTETANMHGILTDCPQRDERMGWMNDATVRFVETAYNFETGRMFPKIVDDIRDEQDGNGAITCTAPFVYGNQPADPVCSSFLIAGDLARVYTGNMDIIRRAYPAFCAWNDCLAARSDGGIVNYSHYGDWAGPAAGCAGSDGAVSAVTPGILMSTGYHYYNTLLLERFARLLGEDRAGHAARSAMIQKAFLDKWFDPETGKVATGSQACQAFALWLGILPEKDRPAAARYMHRKVLSDGLNLTTGNLCTHYLLDMLAEYGYMDTAWALLTKYDYPSWGFMLSHGATTVWERFELKKNPGMNSHSHPMYGAIGSFFYRRLCGISSTETGFRRFRVHPYFPAGLRYVQGVVDTCLGDVRVMWRRQYGALRVHITVPFGAEADIELPGVSEVKKSGVWRYVINE